VALLLGVDGDRFFHGKLQRWLMRAGQQHVPVLQSCAFTGRFKTKDYAMSSILEQYKILAKQDDELDRLRKEDEREPIIEQMEPLWYAMTKEERDEATAYSIHLHSLWSPKDHYEEALEVLRTFPEPHPNDITPPEARASQKAYWIKQRDEALAKMAT
jgi:hypothetical protein